MCRQPWWWRRDQNCNPQDLVQYVFLKKLLSKPCAALTVLTNMDLKFQVCCSSSHTQHHRWIHPPVMQIQYVMRCRQIPVCGHAVLAVLLWVFIDRLVNQRPAVVLNGSSLSSSDSTQLLLILNQRLFHLQNNLWSYDHTDYTPQPSPSHSTTTHTVGEISSAVPRFEVSRMQIEN